MNSSPWNLKIPYPGLRPFDEADHRLFFGRDEQSNELLMRLEDSAFVAVVGSSGSGKSSLVRAGLLPLLRDGFLFETDAWKIAVARPRHEPYERLARKLAALREGVEPAEVLAWLRRSDDGLLGAVNQLCGDEETHVLVVIDQFEELFGFRRAGNLGPAAPNCASREEASAFVAMLLAAARKAGRRLRVMLTMRSDFVGDCEVFLGLPQAISQSQFLVPRLTRSQMEVAITGPSQIRRAEFQPFDFEEGLVNTLINEAGDRPDQLPLLQHALMRTWKLSDRKRLTEADYNKAGRIEMSLSNDADDAYRSLDLDGQELARRLFLLLCDVSMEGQFTRRRPLAQEVLEVAQLKDCVWLERVVRVFQDEDRNFLLPPRLEPITPATVLDVSHESLLRQWRQLREWLEVESKSAQQYRRLLAEVDNGTRFLTDTHLAQAREWAASQRPNPHWARRYDGAASAETSRLPPCLELIARSEEELERRLQAERAAVEEETRRARMAEAAAKREQALQQEKAEIEAQRARDAEAASERFQRRTAAAVAACVVAVIGFGVAIKNLVDAKRATNQAEKARALERQSQADAQRQNDKHFWQFAILARDTKEPDAFKASHLFLRGADALGRITKPFPADRQAILRNGIAASFLDRPLLRSWVHDDAVTGWQFSDDKLWALTWSQDNMARLWDATKPEAVQTFYHAGPVRGAQFSHDASRVLTWSEDKTARLWDVTKPEAIQTFRDVNMISGAQFSRNSLQFLTWSDDKTARLWNVTKSEVVRTFRHEHWVGGAQFSHDASHLVTWCADRTVRLWDLTKPGEATQIFRHDDLINGAQFSHDALHVLTWSDDKTARLWDVTSPEAVRDFPHGSTVTGAQFSRDSSRVLTWSHDKTARLWDVTKPEAIQTFRHQDWVSGARFNCDETRVLTWSIDNTARLWDVTIPKAVQTFHHDGEVGGARFSRDESHVLTWSSDKTTRLWEVTNPEAVQVFRHYDTVRGAQFSPDESCVLTWTRDKTVRLWKVTKPQTALTYQHDAPVRGAHFSRDASHVLTWSQDKTARLWDVTNPKAVRTFQHDSVVEGAQFSRDASKVLTWSADGNARLWDVTMPTAVQTFRHDGTVKNAQFSHDESRVLTWSEDKTARLWDVTNSAPVQTFRHDVEVRGARLSPDESHVLTWSDDTKARLWDVTKPEAIRTFQHDGEVLGAKFSLNASRVLTWSSDNTARLWDVMKSGEVQRFQHDGIVHGALFSRDQSRVLTWCDDKTARLWDVNKPVAIQTFRHDHWVYGAQFSRDESRILTWSDSGTVCLWDMKKALLLHVFRQDRPVTNATFSRDELRVLTCCWGAVHLYDVTKHEPLLTFRHDRYEEFYNAQFNHDESRLLTWRENDNSVRLWDLTDPLAVLTPAERILELEVRSATTLDEQLNLRTLSFAEWQGKAKSPAYRAIEQKLAARPAPRTSTPHPAPLAE
jgi:WD40 repeat protein